MPKALIAGALGVTGRALLCHLEGLINWDIVALSRRAPDFKSRATFLSVDLNDAADCRAQLAGHSDITHIFYTAYSPRKTVAAEIPVNVEILANLMDAIEPITSGLEHVQLMHGAKWYGTFLGTYKTPAREDDPRPAVEHFYHAQQDWLEKRREGASWSWTALRPHGVWGFSTGSAMNLLTGIACYAALAKAEGEPLHWPGNPGFFKRLYQLIDADLLAEAMVWAATTPAARDNAFNITNGDLFRWHEVWPRIAEFFNMEIGNSAPIAISETMTPKAPLWTELVEKHDLQPYALDQLVNWSYLDMALGNDMDQISSLTKIVGAGWTELRDTPSTITHQLRKLRDARIIP
ncbi:MAG: NAD-dependent dehydratase [Alphaproteobacteria bacterium]|nr:NAD-dependent dehydratase [Alphaproteobacteria bacterium]HCP00671.1 NAD-dependent dehydratase [Rhodospirillaceae bacterium]